VGRARAQFTEGKANQATNKSTHKHQNLVPYCVTKKKKIAELALAAASTWFTIAEARPISSPPFDYRPDWDFGPTVLQQEQTIQRVPEEEVFLVGQPASLPSIPSILQEFPEQQLEDDNIRQQQRPAGYPTRQQVEQERRELQNERQQIQNGDELIRPQRPRPSIIQREPEEVFAKETSSSPSSSPSSSNSFGISRPFRPRPVIIQEAPSEFFLKNFPEVAAPEGSDVPLDEQAAIREALFELKKETRSKA